MNKVLNIDIAGQVFRLEELAYENLTTYLEQIHQQLKGWDGAEDILKDIELRIAELLYSFSAEGKAINCEQVEEIIEQVGFIDTEAELDEETPRRSYRDEDNKILGGVCAGLATRFQVPVIILRVVFLALTLLAGLGVVLYLIFWISLDNNNSRNTALAALGKPRTAKQLALYEDEEKSKPVVSFFSSLQRIIFLPISLVGALLSVFGTHLRVRRNNYKRIFIYLLTGFLALLSLLLVAFFWFFEQANYVNGFMNILVGMCIAFLLVLAWAIYVRRFFFTYSDFSIGNELKFGAIVPAVFLGIVYFYLLDSLMDRNNRIVERDFLLSSAPINVVFEERETDDEYHGHPLFLFRTKPPGDDRLTVVLDYSSAGRSVEDATANIEGIDFSYAFANNTLTLSDSFALEDGYANRAQRVTVTVEVPQFASISSPRSFTIRQLPDEYEYRPVVRAFDAGTQYVARGDYFHELNEEFRNRLSDNEREVLEDKFCAEFFIGGQSWQCPQNVRQPVARNRYFDQAFNADADTIEQLRLYMSPNRSLFVSNLSDVNNLIDSLSVDYPFMSDFQIYVNHLIEVKSI